MSLLETPSVPATSFIANGARAGGEDARATGTVPLANAASVRRANVKGTLSLVLASGPRAPSEGPIAVALATTTGDTTPLADATTAVPRVTPPTASETAEENTRRWLLRADAPRASPCGELAPRAGAVTALPRLLAGHARVPTVGDTVAPLGRA